MTISVAQWPVRHIGLEQVSCLLYFSLKMKLSLVKAVALAGTGQ